MATSQSSRSQGLEPLPCSTLPRPNGVADSRRPIIELHPGAFSASTDRACDPCRQRKIRCDRVAPICVNCQRCGLACAYSDRAKRNNSMRKLTDEFEEVEARVKSLEEEKHNESMTIQGVIGGRFDRMEALLQNFLHKTEQVSKTVGEITPESFQSPLKEDPTFKADLAAQSFQERGNPGGVTLETHGVEKYHGSSSIYMLVQDATIGLQDRLKNNPNQPLEKDAKNDEPFMALLDSSKMEFRSSIATLDMKFNRDCEPITLPPEGLMNALVQSFLQDFNSIYPIFDPQCLSDQIKAVFKSPDLYRTTVHPLWLNCLVAHTLSVRCRNKLQGSSDRMMDAELLRPFRDNVRQTISGIGQFSKPVLLNVQTLLLMCIFARDNFHLELAEFLLEQACHCARSMGLHRRQQRSGQGVKLFHERESLFWNLFVLDKNISFLTGKPFLLPSYDCDVQTPSSCADDLSKQYFSSRVDLTIIQEQIYLRLYSAEALRQGNFHREESVNTLSRKLQLWLQEHQELLSKTEFSALEGRSLQHLGLEQSILCGLYHVMVLRRSGQNANAAKCLGVSRSVMENLKNLAERTDLLGKESSLRRIFSSAPFSAFSELLSGLVRLTNFGPSACDDLKLLKRSVEILRTATKSDPPCTYCSGLLEVTSWCVILTSSVLDNAKPYQNYKKRRVEDDSEHPLTTAGQILASDANERTPSQSGSGSDQTAPCSSGTSEFVGTPSFDAEMMEYFEMNSESITADVDWTVDWSAQGN